MEFLLQTSVWCHLFGFVIIPVIYYPVMSHILSIKSEHHGCLQAAPPGSKESDVKIINLPSGLISRYVKNKSS